MYILFNWLFRHECGSENAMKTHLALYLQAQNADASHTQDLAKLAWLRRPRLCISIGELFAFALWRGLRHGYVSPRPCSSRSLCDWDTLPFNLLMRNFKRNSACYEQPRVTSTESSCGVGRAEKTKIPSATVGMHRRAKLGGNPREARQKGPQGGAPRRFGRNFAYA